MIDGGGSPKPRQNICLLNNHWYQKTLAPELEPFKKLFFGGNKFGGVPGGVVPPNSVKMFAF